MDEETVSASHFRVHLKEIANAVASGELACTVERHGLPMGVLVSVEDAEFLRRHKWGANTGAEVQQPSQEKCRADTIRLIHPDAMPIEEVEEAYGLTQGSTDFEIQAWRFKAYYSIRGRTDKIPPKPFGPSG